MSTVRTKRMQPLGTRLNLGDYIQVLQHFSTLFGKKLDNGEVCV